MILDYQHSLQREALQTRLIVELMSNAVHKDLVLKGGMAMRAVHGSARLSKDIDLDADETASKERIQGVVNRAIKQAMASGLIENATVTMPKQTETTLRWKIAGQFPDQGGPMNLTVEVSRRPKLISGHVIEVPLLASFNQGVRVDAAVRIRVMDTQHIAVAKVLCLTDPQRMAPRDLFDLHVLLEAGVQDPGKLLAQLPAERLDTILNGLWPKIEAMDYAQFVAEVKPYLPAAMAEVIDEDAFTTMGLEVGVAVENWMKTAGTLSVEAAANEGAPGAARGPHP